MTSTRCRAAAYALTPWVLCGVACGTTAGEDGGSRPSTPGAAEPADGGAESTEDPPSAEECASGWWLRPEHPCPEYRDCEDPATAPPECASASCVRRPVTGFPGDDLFASFTIVIDPDGRSFSLSPAVPVQEVSYTLEGDQIMWEDQTRTLSCPDGALLYDGANVLQTSRPEPALAAALDQAWLADEWEQVPY